MSEKNLGKEILTLVGNEENIKSVAHCATRLRFTLHDESKANQKAIENLDGVISVVRNGGQFQVVIGTHVNSIYAQVIENTNFNKTESNTKSNEKKSMISLFMETVSSLFTPLLPLLAGSGLLRGIVLLCTQLGVLSDQSSTYFILTATSTAVFYFLPILLAFTAAKKFNCSPFISTAIVGALLMPEFMSLMGDTGNGTITTFLGLPIVLMSYSSTVIPAIMAIYLYSHLERFLNKVIPVTLQLCFVPLISLVIMVPLTAGIVGPLGVYLGNGIAALVNTLINFNGWIAGAVVGGLWNILVIFGIHWAVNPVMIQNISVMGFDYIVPFTCATNFGMAGATFGTFLKTKDQKMKQFSISALLSIFFAGITEPAIYGVGVKYKKPLIAAFIGGAIGGAFMGGMGVKAFAFVFGGLTTIPAFAGETLIYYVIGLAICFGVSTIVMLFLGLDEEKTEVIEEDQLFVPNNEEKIALPVFGEVKDLSECSDEMFAKGVLGQGALIIPSEGKVYAPFDGTMIMCFDTLHAIGLRSHYGTEVLIHVGINTVELNGEPFKLKVEQGAKFKKGDLLLEFDIDKIEKAGKSTETLVLVTNSDGRSTILNNIGVYSKQENILTVE